MTGNIQRALVIGGGIGGLCAAIALRQKGVAVDLIEKEPQWKVWGIGIIHQANAVRAEAMLGVADKVVRQGWAFSGGRVHDAAGAVLFEIPGPPIRPGDLPPDVGITRPRLSTILLDRALALGTTVTLGMTAQVIDNSDNGAAVRFSGGVEAHYDLVVGADGIYSQLRDQMWGEQYRPIFAGQGAWRYNMLRPAELDRVWLFRRPTGPSAGLMPLSDDLMYMWATSNEASAERKPVEGLAEEMRALVADLGGIYGELRDRYLIDSAAVTYRPFEYVDLPQPWHKGSVVLIGDAAHASTAHLAQGAAMSMEDAVVLADEVAAGGNAGEFLPRWGHRRFERSHWIAQASLRICRFEQGKTDDPQFNLMEIMGESRRRTMAPL